MSARADVLLWAQRVIARKDATAHQILELPAGAGRDAARDAFYEIARKAHPDLHRTLPPDELELVTTAYARAAAAYQEIRGTRITTGRIPAIRDGEAAPAGPAPGKPTTRPPVLSDDAASTVPAMSARALLHYRRAELALRSGDLRAAVLYLKMAIASDPQSVFLRSALSEVEAAMTRKP